MIDHDTINDLINEAMLKRQREQKPRDYLGASRWGEECERKLGYEFHWAERDELDQFPGEVLRIFDMGHDSEARMAEYLRLAGFDLQGEQLEFTAADERLAGHCDGLLVGGPLDLPWPIVWENKALNNASWGDVKRKGIEASKPIYFGQLQSYMAYLEKFNGSLITCVNRDTGKIYSEFVPFNQSKAQALSDKALRVVESESPTDLPRLSENPAFWKCGMCDFRKRCHGLNPPAPPQTDRQQAIANANRQMSPPAQNWLFGTPKSL